MYLYIHIYIFYIYIYIYIYICKPETLFHAVELRYEIPLTIETKFTFLSLLSQFKMIFWLNNISKLWKNKWRI